MSICKHLHLLLAYVLTFYSLNAFCATTDDVMRAAGYDVDHATSEASRERLFSIERDVYKITYELAEPEDVHRRSESGT